MRYAIVSDIHGNLPALEAVIGAGAMQEMGAIYASVKDNLPGGLDALPGDNPSPTFRPG